MPENVQATLAALLARAMRTDSEEEARTSAYIFFMAVKKHGYVVRFEKPGEEHAQPSVPHYTPPPAPQRTGGDIFDFLREVARVAAGGVVGSIIDDDRRAEAAVEAIMRDMAKRSRAKKPTSKKKR